MERLTELAERIIAAALTNAFGSRFEVPAAAAAGADRQLWDATAAQHERAATTLRQSGVASLIARRARALLARCDSARVVVTARDEARDAVALLAVVAVSQPLLFAALCIPHHRTFAAATAGAGLAQIVRPTAVPAAPAQRGTQRTAAASSSGGPFFRPTASVIGQSGRSPSPPSTQTGGAAAAAAPSAPDADVELILRFYYGAALPALWVVQEAHLAAAHNILPVGPSSVGGRSPTGANGAGASSAAQPAKFPGPTAAVKLSIPMVVMQLPLDDVAKFLTRVRASGAPLRASASSSPLPPTPVSAAGVGGGGASPPPLSRSDVADSTPAALIAEWEVAASAALVALARAAQPGASGSSGSVGRLAAAIWVPPSYGKRKGVLAVAAPKKASRAKKGEGHDGKVGTAQQHVSSDEDEVADDEAMMMLLQVSAIGTAPVGIAAGHSPHSVTSTMVGGSPQSDATSVSPYTVGAPTFGSLLAGSPIGGATSAGHDLRKLHQRAHRGHFSRPCGVVGDDEYTGVADQHGSSASSSRTPRAQVLPTWVAGLRHFFGLPAGGSEGTTLGAACPAPVISCCTLRGTQLELVGILDVAAMRRFSRGRSKWVAAGLTALDDTSGADNDATSKLMMSATPHAATTRATARLALARAWALAQPSTAWLLDGQDTACMCCGGPVLIATEPHARVFAADAEREGGVDQDKVPSPPIGDGSSTRFARVVAGHHESVPASPAAGGTTPAFWRTALQGCRLVDAPGDGALASFVVSAAAAASAAHSGGGTSGGTSGAVSLYRSDATGGLASVLGDYHGAGGGAGSRGPSGQHGKMMQTAAATTAARRESHTPLPLPPSASIIAAPFGATGGSGNLAAQPSLRSHVSEFAAASTSAVFSSLDPGLPAPAGAAGAAFWLQTHAALHCPVLDAAPSVRDVAAGLDALSAHFSGSGGGTLIPTGASPRELVEAALYQRAAEASQGWWWAATQAGWANPARTATAASLGFTAAAMGGGGELGASGADASSRARRLQAAAQGVAMVGSMLSSGYVQCTNVASMLCLLRHEDETFVRRSARPHARNAASKHEKRGDVRGASEVGDAAACNNSPNRRRARSPADDTVRAESATVATSAATDDEAASVVTVSTRVTAPATFWTCVVCERHVHAACLRGGYPYPTRAPAVGQSFVCCVCATAASLQTARTDIFY